MAGQGPQLEGYEHEQVSDLTLYLIRCVISGFRRVVDENCAIMGYYAARSVVISYRLVGTNYRSYLHLGPLKMGQIDFPETSARSYHYSLRSDPEERSSHLVSFSF
jgi:hypothetical protein